MRALLLAMFLMVLPAQAAARAALKAGTFDPPRLAPEFALPGTHGKPLSLKPYRGKVVLLGFGFTSCRAVCPITLSTLKQATKLLGAQADDVQVVYITVDPEHDDVATLGRYLRGFDPRFVGGTGTEAQLDAVRKAYGVFAEEKAGPDGAISHSSFVYLIDTRGRLVALMPYGRDAADYVHDVRVLLGAQ
jgi:protein SCO1/2